MNERDIFMEALDCTSPDSRQAFLDKACGQDSELRRRVEALLKSHDDANSFLERPAISEKNTAWLSDSEANRATPPGGQEGFDRADVELATALEFLEPCDTPDRLGKIGVYEIMEVVGYGGMGIVLKGYDTKLQRVVAIKVLTPELSSNALARRRFLREARAAAAVTHDHVVTFHAVEEADQLPASRMRMPYLVMEYISGQSLQQRIDATGPLEVSEILRIGMQAAEGLAAAHKQGIVHRDIKPSNILLENGVERVKISDFGLARAVDDVGMTRSGMVTGSPQYMSPEQARGDSFDQRTDLFSLGSVMYAMCTGRSPFRAESSLAALRRICDDTPRPIEEVNPEIPDWLARIIDRLLAKEPASRYQTAAEVAKLLGEYLAHLQQPSQVLLPQPLVAETPANLERRSYRGKAVVTAALLLLLVGLGATEVTGVTSVTEFVTTVLRIDMPEGTLVVSLDDPEIDVAVDGEEITLSHVGPHEIHLSPGRHRLQAFRDGALKDDQWVSITKGSKQVVEISFETASDEGPDNADVDSVRPLQPSTVLNAHTDQARSVAFSPDGKLLASGGFDAMVKIWSTDSWTDTAVLKGHTRKVKDVAFSPDGAILASAALDSTIRLWDVETGEEVAALMAPERETYAIAFSPDGTVLASTHKDATLRIWDLNSLTQRWVLRGHSGPIEGVAFSQDGTLVASTAQDDTVRIWDVVTGREREVLFGRAGFSVAFSQDGQLLARGGPSSDGIAIHYLSGSSSDAGQQHGIYPRETAGVLWGLDFGPHSRTLAACWGDPSSRAGSWGIWDLETQKQVFGPEEPSSSVWSVAFSPGGGSLATAHADGAIRVWDIAGGNGKVLVPPEATSAGQAR